MQKTEYSQDQVFNPESEEGGSSSPYRKPRNRKNSLNGSWGKWSLQENLKYIMFMENNIDTFISKQKRRISRVFKAMSKIILTRTAIQCRSHHQKLIAKYKNFKRIISEFKAEIGEQNYRKNYQIFLIGIKNYEGCPQNQFDDSQHSNKSVEVQTEAVIVIDVLQQPDLNSMNYLVNQWFSQAYSNFTCYKSC